MKVIINKKACEKIEERILFLFCENRISEAIEEAVIFLKENLNSNIYNTNFTKWIEKDINKELLSSFIEQLAFRLAKEKKRIIFSADQMIILGDYYC